MTDRREYTEKDRRGAGKVFQTAEVIRARKEDALNKLREYETDVGVGIISFIVHAVAISSTVWALVGTYVESSTLLWTGVVGTIAALALGEKWIRVAKRKARERFEKDPNKHLLKYLPS